jgi:hypothetical protein
MGTVYSWPPSGGASASEVETAVIDALETVFPTTTVATRYHDTATTTIPAFASNPVEIRVDSSSTGAVVPFTKALQITCTFGSPIGIYVGSAAASATIRCVLNLGGFIPEIPVIIAAGQRIYVKTMNADTVTSGVLTVNLLG